MEPGFEDAKAVWEKLLLQGKVEGEQTDVDVTSFPKPEEVIAELRYSFDQTEWAAVVTKDTDEGGTPCFRLWFQRGERFQKSGIFPDGTQLAAYIRSQAGEAFKRAVPAIDTLDKLKFKTAASVVPECFRAHGRTAKCGVCPYEPDCFMVVGVDSAGIVHVTPGDNIVTDIEIVEPEEVFLRRLQGKVTDQWGGPELETIFLDEADDQEEVSAECPLCDGTGQLELINDATGEEHTTECGRCQGTGTRRPGDR